ncbi:MAG: hypothetical protein JO303_02275 [Caulobacteraceae bacterium]|nr:hypothetical protein [Caulobacteraceae bacterium]
MSAAGRAARFGGYFPLDRKDRAGAASGPAGQAGAGLGEGRPGMRWGANTPENANERIAVFRLIWFIVRLLDQQESQKETRAALRVEGPPSRQRVEMHHNESAPNRKKNIRILTYISRATDRISL